MYIHIAMFSQYEQYVYGKMQTFTITTNMYSIQNQISLECLYVFGLLLVLFLTFDDKG